MFKKIKLTCTLSVSIATFIFMFIPEIAWLKIKLLINKEDYLNIILNRVLFFVALLCVIFIMAFICSKIQWQIYEHTKNHDILVKYCDIIKTKKGMRIINFDECFTTTIGDGPGDIRDDSVCGQYLKLNPNLDVTKILQESGIQPEKKRKSKYMGKECYNPGTMVQYENDLLLAFAKLNQYGQAEFDSLDDYLKCLNNIWKGIYSLHSNKNVCIPVLGSGRTKLNGVELSQQEILDIMIFSYKISEFKLKDPYKLIICCKRRKNFSIAKVGNGFINFNCIH